ncbi:MAG: ExeA family protein [Gammaproteobacteria bacterium]|nr:ExeA family protein [Gammaproteobacteria bacterium]
MYLSFYGLEEYPFSLTPNTRFFLSYGHYQDALNTLLVALDGGEGFIKITGEVGTGKTLLCRRLLHALSDKFTTAYLPNPDIPPLALLHALSDELEIANHTSDDHYTLQRRLSRRLIELNSRKGGGEVVLCIDEAQAMPLETLEGLRLLTNLETESRKLLQVVLFGQPELNRQLEQEAIRQLKQRITFSYHLQPLAEEEIATYIEHRLHQAGGESPPRFSATALRRLYHGSHGYPRLINILAHKALLAGFGEGEKRISGRHVKMAIADTDAAFPLRFWQ